MDRPATRAKLSTRAGGVALAMLLAATAACVPRTPQPPAEPQPTPTPTPTARPPAPPPPPADWRDAPLTPGDWYYSADGAGSRASYGVPSSEAQFLVRCDRARREITLSREGTGSGGPITIRTTYGPRAFAATARTEPLPYLSAAVPASDRFLDSMAFSRGRFTVEAPGLPTLFIPTWPAPARVVEDCRS